MSIKLKCIAALLGLGIATEVALFIMRRLFRCKGETKSIMFRDDSYRCCRSGACSNEKCQVNKTKKIVAQLDSAQTSMDLCLYVFTMKELGDAVQRAHDRGVFVRIISDYDMAFANGSRIPPLHEIGVPIKVKESGSMMHHKYCVIDAPSRVAEINKMKKNKAKGKCVHPHGLLITGSMNWTQSAIRGNFENVSFIKHLKLVDQFHKEFERLWLDFEPIIVSRDGRL